jgi:hypothetical protein
MTAIIFDNNPTTQERCVNIFRFGDFEKLNKKTTVQMYAFPEAASRYEAPILYILLYLIAEL